MVVTQATTAGEIADSFWAPDMTDINARFYLTATGVTSGLKAENTFTDSGVVTITITGNGYVDGNASSPSAGFWCSNPANTPSSDGTYSYTCGPTGHGTTANAWTAHPASGYQVGTWTFSPAVTSVTGCTSGDASCSFEVNTATSLALTFTATSGATKLAFTTAPASLTAATCSTAFVVTSENSGGTATSPSSTETVTLTSTDGTATFYSDSGCTTVNSAPTIGTSATTATFYVKDTAGGSTTITASGSGAFSSAPTQAETVNKANQATLTANVTSPATYLSTQTLTTTGGSGTGAVSYSVGASTACSVSGTTLTHHRRHRNLFGDGHQGS